MALNALDPRAPFVLDIRELGRRPGAMRRVSRVVPAPAGLGLEGVVGVPEEADVELELRLESVMEGALVSGTVQAPFTGECARCLDPIEDDVLVDLQELYSYSDKDDPEAEEDGLFVVDELIDLEQPVRDAVVLALPLAPVCREDCPGLCSVCGARLEDDPSHQHEATDPRWAALAELLADDSNESGSSGAGPTEEI
ncbi:YceD family protein [Phytoactinopolyspora endophytica]|uniref:YceD family protein n=1 Tax=Phytoactinopolyspora endophytica TaxID=1642495 RepID=UPI00101BB788